MALAKPIILYCAGCFNPITNKHLRIMELARDALHKTGKYKVLRGILSPAHDKYGKEGLVPASHRIEMMRLAVKSNPWLSIDNWELQQANWTPTALGLKALKERLQSGEMDSLFYNDNVCQNDDDGPQSKKRKTRAADAPRDKASSSAVNSSVLGGRGASLETTAQPRLVCGGDLLESFAVPDLWAKDHMEIIVRDYGLVVIVRDGSDPYKYIYENDMLSKYSHNIDVVTDWIGDDSSSTKVRKAIKRNESIKYLVQDPVLDYILEHKLYNPDYRPSHLFPTAQDQSVILSPEFAT